MRIRFVMKAARLCQRAAKLSCLIDSAPPRATPNPPDSC
ncbi:hypothetical protein BVG79_00522 [Ketogulonicigenium robustum]|uniref:Uncharacterized protein n=1 Tax=Ketogulonicigenium robustum TaxID=92947 RepID=A0A1W6NXB9_9RHOB|nr:hypothetical protein BVG79_00522 [Ketogulonicigenium robustum]